MIHSPHTDTITVMSRAHAERESDAFCAASLLAVCVEAMFICQKAGLIGLTHTQIH